MTGGNWTLLCIERKKKKAPPVASLLALTVSYGSAPSDGALSLQPGLVFQLFFSVRPDRWLLPALNDESRY